MKISDVRELSDGELRTRVVELSKELWKARFDNFSNRLDNTSKLGQTRRTIARMRTILTERAAKQGKQAEKPA